MVLKLVWMQSWISLILSVVSLVILIFFIFFCTCFERKKKTNHFYIIDERGIRRDSTVKDFATNSTCNLNLFRRFSKTVEPENVFTSKNLPFCALKNERKHESDLVDSLEVTKSFDGLMLTFEDTDVPLTSRDELRSCISTESLNSFYSAHPSIIAKGNSRDSFVSLISESEADGLIV